MMARYVSLEVEEVKCSFVVENQTLSVSVLSETCYMYTVLIINDTVLSVILLTSRVP